jgi:hypothetical protein
MGYTNQPNDVWQHQIEKLKLLFPQLTDEDFRYDYGEKEVMMMKLQKKLGKSREQLNSLIVDL